MNTLNDAPPLPPSHEFPTTGFIGGGRYLTGRCSKDAINYYKYLIDSYERVCYDFITTLRDGLESVGKKELASGCEPILADLSLRVAELRGIPIADIEDSWCMWPQRSASLTLGWKGSDETNMLTRCICGYRHQWGLAQYHIGRAIHGTNRLREGLAESSRWINREISCRDER